MSLNGYPVYPDLQHGPWRATRAEAEKAVGRRLPEELFQFIPWGRRMLLAREAPETTYGSILIPQSAQDSNTKAYGWVIAAGDLVGAPDSRLPLGFSAFGPAEILLRKLAFGRHAGITYSVLEDPEKERVREQYGLGNPRPLHPYMILTDGDILGEIITNFEEPRP